MTPISISGEWIGPSSLERSIYSSTSRIPSASMRLLMRMQVGISDCATMTRSSPSLHQPRSLTGLSAKPRRSRSESTGAFSTRGDPVITRRKVVTGGPDILYVDPEYEVDLASGTHQVHFFHGSRR